VKVTFQFLHFIYLHLAERVYLCLSRFLIWSRRIACASKLDMQIQTN